MKFAEKVYSVVKKIPKGKVVTYKAIAQAIGKPRAARAVGKVLNRNPFLPKVPCHRVVRSDGDVGGYARGIQKKIALLRKEGVRIKDGKINLRLFGYRL